MYVFLYYAISVLMILLLVILPLYYSICTDRFWRGFWFTWMVWAIVVLVYGIFLPAVAQLTMLATGEMPDIADAACGFPMMGIVFGWAPGFVLTAIGKGVKWILIETGIIRKKTHEADIRKEY